MKKGFTLIELLVVIAIIGILASVVLIGFPSATKKANDSRVISAIGQARTIMTYIGANEGDYEDFEDVSTSSEMHVIWNEINENDNGDAPGIQGGTEEQGACIYAKLNAKDDYWYCADSTGVAGTVTGSANDPADTCDGTTFVCPTLD